MTVSRLRDYQRETLDEVSRCLSTHESTAAVLATGLGKTVTFVYQTREFLAANPGKRVLILVHRNELAGQTVAKMNEHAPDLKIGIVQGAVREVDPPVIVASVWTLGQARAGALRDSIKDVGLVIVDECHRAPYGVATYDRLFDHWASVPATGYTATFMRADGLSLAKRWKSIAINRDILWGVRHEHLIMPRGKRIIIPDLHLTARKGDWTDEQIADALADSFAPDLVVKAWLEHASDRKTIGFLPSVATAYRFQEAFQQAGIWCEVVHGGMDPRDRKPIYDAHPFGGVLLSCMVLTEGYDDPEVNAILQGRPTKNQGLYIQMTGRGLRPNLKSGVPIRDQDCLILNVTAIDVPGLCSIPDLSDETRGKPDADGASLLDLTLELDAGEEIQDEDAFYSGDVEVVDFEALAGMSRARWLKTQAGISFLPVGQGAFVFLIPDAIGDRYQVAWCSRYVTEPLEFQGQKRAGGRTEHLNLPYGLAALAAEELGAALAGVTGGKMRMRKSGPWRDREPTRADLKEAINAQVHYRPNVTAGELSDLTDTVIASRRVDALVARMKERA